MRLRVLGIVLAGGKGTRLYPLTKERAKPAVPFGGKYPIVDFVLSNLINSGIHSVYLLTQFKSQSLLPHLSARWQFAALPNDHYIFAARPLLPGRAAARARGGGSHDSGPDVLPRLVDRLDIFAYDFQTNEIPGEALNAPAYWRDVGTLDAYYEAHMDLRAVSPALNLYNREWPLLTASYADPPAKFTFDDDGPRGQAIDSVVSAGCILSGGIVLYSVLDPH